MDSKNQEADVAQNKLVSFVFVFLGVTDEATFFLESKSGESSDERRISFPQPTRSNLSKLT